MKTKSLLLSVLAFSLLINACSKEESKPAKQSSLVCSITSTTEGMYNGTLITKFTYDENDNIIKEEQIDEDGRALNTKTYQYEGGKRINMTEKNGSYQATSTYEYDATGNLIRDNTSGNATCHERLFEYSGSLLTKETFVDCWLGQYNIHYSIENEYNTQGKKIKETHHQTDGSLSYGYTYEYENGLLIKRNVFYGGGITETATSEYTYDSEGRLIKDPNWITYTYDEFNRLKTESIPGDDTFEVKTYEYCD
ncbi:MAG: hypothetical protein IPN76_01770 [Saprospiraceae bacterium]|nr:hypothetical protein [Saprospiraceae bacterium]